MNVTLTVWRIPVRRAPAVAWRLARDRAGLRRAPGVRFVKLLGTSRGFGGMDPTRWAALIVSDRDAPPLGGWRRLASTECRLDLRPVASKGRWAGMEPFAPSGPAESNGMMLVLTRARLRPARAIPFWRAIGPVGRAVTAAPGLLTAFGIGEAPIGWQGTVSLWRSGQDLVEFAYRQPDHRRVMAQTPAVGWYAEELYARFAVRRVDGDPSVIGCESIEAERSPA